MAWLDKYPQIINDWATYDIEFSNHFIRFIPQSNQNDVRCVMDFIHPTGARGKIEGLFWYNKHLKKLTLQGEYQISIQLSKKNYAIFNTIDGDLIKALGDIFHNQIPTLKKYRTLFYFSLEEQKLALKDSILSLNSFDHWFPKLTTSSKSLGNTFKIGLAFGVGYYLYKSFFYHFEYKAWDETSHLLFDIQKECGQNKTEKGCAKRVLDSSSYASPKSIANILTLIAQFQS